MGCTVLCASHLFVSIAKYPDKSFSVSEIITIFANTIKRGMYYYGRNIQR